MHAKDEERFWSKAMPEPNSGCWLWLGPISTNGYGNFGVGSRLDGSHRTVMAHRMACALAHGGIPDGLQALHKCDNRGCINPDHLYIGNQSQNMNDAFRRKRKTPRRKITKKQAAEIRASNASQYALADQFGLSQGHVSDIKRGRYSGEGFADGT